MAHSYQRTDLRRRQIAEAALAIIAEDGLRALTTRAIAERVGITDGTIFRHFKNKAEIMLAALDSLEDKMFGDDEAAIADPLERLRAIFYARVGLVSEPHSVGRLVFSEELIHAVGEAGRARIVTWRARNLALIVGCLRELAEAGRLRRDVAPMALVPVVQGVILTAFVDRSLPEASERALETHVDLLWRTVSTLILAAA